MKITLFEPHFEGAQIGPQSLGSDSDTPEETSEESESGSRIGPLLGVLMIVGLVIGAGYALRQNREDLPMDMDKSDLKPLQ